VSDRIEALEARVAELEQTIRDLKALAKGDAGRDGRDGRDGKSLNPRQIVAMLRDIVPTYQASSVIVQPAAPQIVVQASEVSLKATLPAPVVENHVHVDGVMDMAKATRDAVQMLGRPMRAVRDATGHVIGGERVKEL
jgi:hypothetical protein